ncbi:ORC-CDC6 family AAA ATPase [Corynebacterium variabile]|uniref:ORC-CDC6 family AAA ATPase n=1 Tax=Corynebacterium variabile TaxID=1727 RepID=UPI003FD1BE93
MSADLFYRTEDLDPEEVIDYYVETKKDREIVDYLKSRTPIILKGSRGVGKSFLLRVAEQEMDEEFKDKRQLPVYLTFGKTAVLRIQEGGFIPWMMSRMAMGLNQALMGRGLSVPANSSIKKLVDSESGVSLAEQVVTGYENFWDNSDTVGLLGELPDLDSFKSSIVDTCAELDIKRVVFLIDEAAHIFVPSQQREFFTMMRDLRSSKIAVKAAVYPGVTSYGPSFQPVHDATVVAVDRSVADEQYASSMREIVIKQDGALEKSIAKRGEDFDILSFAATGNPRILLNTISYNGIGSSNQFSKAIREYYRNNIWQEHSDLADRYPGHRTLIDWGRVFIETSVLPSLHGRNADKEVGEMVSAIWVHRDAPRALSEALRLLCYSGILQEGESGVKGTRSEIGTRYLVNLGCNLAQDSSPLEYGKKIRSSTAAKRFVEYGKNHSAFKDISEFDPSAAVSEDNKALYARLDEPISVLDLTESQLSKLAQADIRTVRQALMAPEEDFQKIHYVGPVRSRRIRNAAIAATLEYLSG